MKKFTVFIFWLQNKIILIKFEIYTLLKIKNIVFVTENVLLNLHSKR